MREKTRPSRGQAAVGEMPCPGDEASGFVQAQTEMKHDLQAWTISKDVLFRPRPVYLDWGARMGFTERGEETGLGGHYFFLFP